METLDHLDRLASWVREVFKVCLGKREKLDGMERLGLPVHRDRQEKEGCLACLGFLDLKVIADFLVWMGQREKWEGLE